MDKVIAAVRRQGIMAQEVREIDEELFVIKGPFHGDMIGLYLYDAATGKVARFTWHGVNIGDYAISTRANKIIAVCVHPPRTQTDDERATVMGYDIRRIRADLRQLSRKEVERTTDAGSYGFIVVRPGYLFRALEYREDGIYFAAETKTGEEETYFLQNPGDPPIRARER